MADQSRRPLDDGGQPQHPGRQPDQPCHVQAFPGPVLPTDRASVVATTAGPRAPNFPARDTSQGSSMGLVMSSHTRPRPTVAMTTSTGIAMLATVS